MVCFGVGLGVGLVVGVGGAVGVAVDVGRGVVVGVGVFGIGVAMGEAVGLIVGVKVLVLLSGLFGPKTGKEPNHPCICAATTPATTTTAIRIATKIMCLFCNLNTPRAVCFRCLKSFCIEYKSMVNFNSY
jgi:hypothetical protein